MWKDDAVLAALTAEVILVVVADMAGGKLCRCSVELRHI